MRLLPLPQARLAPDLRALHDEMAAHLRASCLVSVLLNAYDMSVPGREEGLPVG